MSITSGWFIGLIISLAVISFAIALFVVPRRRRRGILMYIEQFFALVMTSLLILLSIAAILNAQNHWYTNWESLLGATANQSTTVTNHGGQTTELTATKEANKTPTALQADPQQNPLFGSQIGSDTSQGQYVKFTWRGDKSGFSTDVLIWLPPSYFNKTQEFFPVIVGFPGYPGSVDSYKSPLNYGDRMMNQVKAKTLRESILVVPNTSPAGYDTECVDGSRGNNPPKAETFVTQDLVPWIKANLRTMDSPGAWATSGYSAGGYCAAMFSVKHPDLFGNALVQAGYFAPVYSPGQEWNDPADPHYDLGAVVSKNKPDVGIFFYTSLDDTIAVSGLEPFTQKVEAPTSFTTATVPVGGHRFEVWMPGVDHGLEWLAKRSSSFAYAP